MELPTRIDEKSGAWRLGWVSALCLFLHLAGHAALAQSAMVSGTVKDQGGSTPGDAQVALVRSDKTLNPYRKKVDPNTGKFKFEDVAEGQYDLVACAGALYLPRIVPIVVQANKPVEKLIILENAGKDEKRVITVTVMDRNNNRLPRSQALAYAYECMVAQGTTDVNAEREFNVPVPPARYKFAAARKPGRGPTTAEEVSLTPRTRRVTLFLNDKGGTRATLTVELEDDLPLIPRIETPMVNASAGDNSGGNPAFSREGIVGNVRGSENPSSLDGIGRSPYYNENVRNELQPVRGGYLTPRDAFPSLQFNDLILLGFHGTLQYGLRHDALDARNFFNLPDFDTFRRHTGQIKVSGPIPKVKNVSFALDYNVQRGVEAPTFSPILTSQLPALNRQFSRLGLPEEDLRRFLITSATDQPTVRLIYKPGARQTLTLRYVFRRELLQNALSLGDDKTLDAPSAANSSSYWDHSLDLQYTWNPSSTLDVVFKYTFRRNLHTNDPVEPQEISLHIPGLARTGRALNLVEGNGQGLSSHLLSLVVQKISGKHTLRGGAQFGFDRNVFQFDAFVAGRAITPALAPLFATVPVADLFQLGIGGSQVAFDASFQNYYASYIYKLRSLTLSASLRNKVELPPSFQHRELNGLQPLVGLAWAIDPKTTLRLTYNLTRDRLPQIPIGFELLMGGQGLQSAVPQPPRRITSFVGDVAATLAFNQFLTSRSIPAGPQLATTFDPESRSPAIQIAGLQFMRELQKAVKLDFVYLFASGSHLLTKTNTNLPPPTFANGRADFQNAVINSAFAQIYQFQTVGNSSYHRGSLGVRFSPYKDFSLNGTFTLLKSIDDVPSGSFEATPENVYDRRRERAVSDLHFGRELYVQVNWSKEIIRRDKQISKKKGEIFFIGTFNARSGHYFTVLTGFDANHDGNPLTDRPLGVGRNTFLGPSYARMDLLVGASLNVGEGKSFELRLQSFNLLNRANFLTFDTVLGRDSLSGLDERIVLGSRGLPGYDFRRPLTPNGFGVATSADTPRRVQVELRFNF